MVSDERQDRWQRRYQQAVATSVSACGVLAENAFLLPKQGRALDLACGRGGNALLLARQGLDVEAWDYAPAAIEALRRQARSEALSLDAVLRDVEQEPPGPASFDVITVSYFLERAIVPGLVRALRPGGLIFYETWLGEAIDDSGPGNPDFRLGVNELLDLFGELQLLFYQEHARVGDHSQGLRNIARLVARS